jgi:hypothetical protein
MIINLLSSGCQSYDRGSEKVSVKNKMGKPNEELKAIAKAVLKEAKKRAKYEMECLTELVLHEARIVARYARNRPFYIS